MTTAVETTMGAGTGHRPPSARWLGVYPALVTHAVDRTMLYSPDGKTWTTLKTVNDPVDLQASTNLDALNGYYQVAIRGSISASGTPSPGPTGGGGGSPVTWVVIGAAIVVAGALAVVRVRSRAHAREFASYRDPEPRRGRRR